LWLADKGNNKRPPLSSAILGLRFFSLRAFVLHFPSQSILQEKEKETMFDRVPSGVWQHLLPHYNHHPEPSIPPVRVSLVAVRVRYLIEQLISVEVKVCILWIIVNVSANLVNKTTFSSDYQSCVESCMGSWR
jgi:hypothetical protein